MSDSTSLGSACPRHCMLYYSLQQLIDESSHCGLHYSAVGQDGPRYVLFLTKPNKASKTVNGDS